MYGQDSFFTLSIPGQVGLALLSLAMAGIMIAMAWRFFHRRWARLIWALGLFWAFLWVSPQVYYFYYGFLFENLPDQWVVGVPPTLPDVLRLMVFSERADLSHHGRAILGWLMVFAALFGRKRHAPVF